MTNPFPFIIDAFTKSRGDPCLICIHCKKCSKLIFIYQKDGPGPLKRSYLDRICRAFIDLENSMIRCPSCEAKLGFLDVYEKESRKAIYWFADCVESQLWIA